MKESVLAVYPHPDDETFGKAGTLIKHSEAGDEITLICSTLGQMGRRMGKPFFANRETLPGLREKELMDACKEIGITDVRLWKMQDKMLQFRNPDTIANRILKVIEEKKPAIIYTFYPEHGVHPDHDAMSRATILAVSKLPIEKRPQIYGSAITRHRLEELGKPDVIVDVTDVLDKKMKAMRAHRSQSELITSVIDQKIRANPEKEKEIMAPYTKEPYWIYHFSDSVV